MNGLARGSVSVEALVRFVGITVLGIAAGAAGSPRAQTTSSSSSSSSARQVKKASSGTDSKLDSGTVSAGVYRNPTFGFTCKIPAGWVLRTEEMNSRESESAGAEKTAAHSVHAVCLLLEVCS